MNDPHEPVLAALLDVLPIPVRIFDNAGMLVRRNATATSFDANMRGTTLRDFWERDQPRLVEGGDVMLFADWPGTRALVGHTVRAQRMIVVRRHLRHTIELSAAPIIGAREKVTGVVVVEREIEANAMGGTTDAITEVRARDRRLAAIGQLAAGVMHDVNNALSPIMQAAYLLRLQADNPVAVRDFAERIRIAAETGAATASRVGRFIRQEPLHGKLESLLELGHSMDEVLELSLPMHRGRNPERGIVNVVRDYSPDITIRGNAGEIREALLNLVQNASDAMPGGGTLTARTYVADGLACIEVSDTGEGMSPEVRERAFEPFFSTKGAGGTGLGLAEVYGIAKRHGGSAVIESTAGHGTAVTLCFPLERTAPPVHQVESGTSIPMHLLVVEDHDEGREFLRRLLTAEGHSVDAVQSCRDARERLESNGTAYDVMITDVGLPDCSGWDLVAHARERLPSLRVGVITGWEPSAQRSDMRGAAFVLRKPLRAAELLAHIAGRDTPASA
jgi:signal transduction histidine kinase/CheY-like chemotaxis protein